ncbi:MAG: alpha/beta hydrolase [Alphaproteobacteria bacterium]|nr:alpha/beta hydrolase [Alphaproteobacteria bacterium]
MRKNILIESQDGNIVVAKYNYPPKGQRQKNTPLVIMIHGFQNTHEYIPTLFSNISDKLEYLGLSSLLYDYNNQQKIEHSDQQLCYENIKNDLNTLFIWAQKNHFPKIAFIVEGLGASLLYMNLPDNSVFSILFWPILNLKEFVKSQKISQQLNTNLVEGLCIDEKFLEKMEQIDLHSTLKNVHIPTLIMHGLDDSIVPQLHLDEARLHLMAPWLDITTFEDGQHGLICPNHEKACQQHITNFIRKYAQNDPSDSPRDNLFKF